MRKIIDISLTLVPDLPVWPGDPPILLERFSKMEDGSVCNISRMAIGVHTGTHLDAPFHFVHGASTVESIPVDRLIGTAWVMQVPEDCKLIDQETLESLEIPRDCERIIFKTRNSHFWEEKPLHFHQDFTAISPDGARWLVDRGVKLVGVDYLSVAPFNDGVPTHRVLLEAKVVAVEGLNLSGVEAGQYELICLPMKLGGADGAPARVLLLQS